MEPLKIALPGSPLKCSAHSSQTGAPCNNWAMLGQTKCHSHGGRAPQSRRAAERRLASVKVGHAMGRILHAGEDIDPLQSLVLELSRSAVIVEVLQMEVAELALHPDEGEAIYGPDHTGDDKPHVLVQMLNDERERKAKFSKWAIEAGVAERQVGIAEDLAAMIAGVFAAFIDDKELGLSPPQRRRARHVAARRLRALPSAG